MEPVPSAYFTARLTDAFDYARALHANQVRKGTTVPYIAHLGHAPIEVRRVAAADKLHDARAILVDYRHMGERLWARFNAGRDEQLWYYRNLVTALRSADATGESASLVDQLDDVVSALEEEARD